MPIQPLCRKRAYAAVTVVLDSPSTDGNSMMCVGAWKHHIGLYPFPHDPEQLITWVTIDRATPVDAAVPSPLTDDDEARLIAFHSSMASSHCEQ